MSYRVDEKGNYVRTVRCGYCYEKGHNKLSCPKRKQDLKQKVAAYEKEIVDDNFRDDWDRDYTKRRLKECKAELDKSVNRGKNRRCSYCGETGHTRRTCQYRKSDIESEAQRILAGRKILAPLMEEHGVGVGALLEYDDDIYTVHSIDWDSITQDSIIGKNGHAQSHSQPIMARSFPTEYYTRGRFQGFTLPDEVTNVHNAELSSWAKCNWKMLSPSPSAPPSDFLDIEKCRSVSKGLGMFNGKESRPYKYLYPDD